MQQQQRRVWSAVGEKQARLHALIMRLARTHCFPPVAKECIAELNKKTKKNPKR